MWKLIQILFIVLACTIIINGELNGVTESVDPTSQGIL